MTKKTKQPPFTNRMFIAAIRSKLDAAGYTDIPVHRQWIDEDEPGYPFLLRVPVGPELTLPLKTMERFHDDRSAESLERNASEFVMALVNIHKAQKMLLKYAADVKKEAVAQIVAAREVGLDVQVASIGFKPTYAFHMAGADWKDAAFHVLAEVIIRHTSFYLQPETSQLWVEETTDIAGELADILEEQRARQDRLKELDALDADLLVDQISIDLLEAHGVDVAATLTKAWKEQCVNLNVEYDGKPATLSIITSNGVVNSSFQFGELCWNGEYLWFHGELGETDYSGLLHKSIGDVAGHPVFASRPIVRVDAHGEAVRNLIYFETPATLRFDVESGALKHEERLAA
ncbi:hypothetical protein [Sphingobium yanoikuyae]|uniref:Uncharacterized protein n=1 Tax=Sphingobium yanoikuyae TaxID=13690 RepID=A0A430BDM2_SPHYA|nr:hypothetical protein [Sphingobium yanoikuyae]RSU46920.1 hypothetical protein DAH51_25380 [Sphingobium yanoikuyae]